MQPLDTGVLVLLKKQVVKKNTQENPGCPFNKGNFAAKLAEAQTEFYKPSITVNSFRATGIFPVNRAAISDSMLKPSQTFETSPRKVQEKPEDAQSGSSDTTAGKVYSTALSSAHQNKQNMKRDLQKNMM